MSSAAIERLTHLCASAMIASKGLLCELQGPSSHESHSWLSARRSGVSLCVLHLSEQVGVAGQYLWALLMNDHACSGSQQSNGHPLYKGLWPDAQQQSAAQQTTLWPAHQQSPLPGERTNMLPDRLQAALRLGRREHAGAPRTLPEYT